VTNMPGIFEGCIAFDQNLGNWDISSVVSVSSFDGMNNMFKNAGLSITNYDNTLIGWNTLDPGETQIPTGIRLNGGNGNYCVSATQRQDLITTYGWTFTDAGQSCPNVTVPNVVGIQQTDAETTFTNEGLLLGTITETYSTTIPAGTVISQNPTAGTSIAMGSTIDIEVSLGNYPLLITGIISKNNESLGAIELYAVNDIPDLSIYAVGVENGFDGSEGPEYYLSGSASAGDFIYLAEYPTVFHTFFGFAADFDMGGTNGLLPSGNDAVELFMDVNNTPTRIDVFGDPNINGFGTAWAYKNSWVYRKTGTVANGSFVINDWRIPGPEIISSVSITNGNAPVPFPMGTYGQAYDDVPPVAVCQDISFEVNQGNNRVDASLLDNGSSDDVGVAFMKLDDEFFNCSEEGLNPVIFTVYDAAGNKAECAATINISLAPPVVTCQDITVNLSFNGQITVEYSDIRSDTDGACLGEISQFYVSTTDPNGGTSNGLFDGATTSSSPTDDIINTGTGIYYQEIPFTVPADGNYFPVFNFSSSTTDDILVAIIYDQPVVPNSGEVTDRPGFLDGFVYEAPSSYQGSFTGDDEVALIAGTTYYMQVLIFNSNDPTLLSTGTFTGDFGSGNLSSDEITYTTSNLGDNTLYAVVIDDLGRMSSCAATVTVETLDPFTTTWKTDNLGTSNDNQITLPTIGSGRFDIDWGDGSIMYNRLGNSNITHTYSTPGTYTVRITGDLRRFRFNGGGDAAKLLTIERWGNIKWTNMSGAFFGCTNLDVTAIDTPDLSDVTDMSLMFTSCENLIGTTAFGAWDVSNVQNMSNAFSGTDAFNQDISTWNTSNVTDMSFMFQGSEGINQDLLQSNGGWNTGNVTNMTSMFSGAVNFDGDISNWDVSQVLTMNYMFENTPLDQNLSAWNPSSAIEMRGMFLNASNFNSDIGNWDVSNVADMVSMLANATSFDQDLGDWDITNLGNSTFGNAINMFENVTLSKDNYDNTLLGWHTDSSGMAGDGIDDVPSGINFNGGNSKYCVAETERQDLVTTYNWTITDSGIACPRFQVKVFLQGASLGVTVNSFLMMRDALRANNLIPTTSPYDGIATFDPGILSNNDEEAIVDWVLVELRDATDNTNVVFSDSFLLRRDGFITSTTEGTLRAKVPDGDYYIAIKHRNHLGIMSATPISIFPDNFTVTNFSDGTTATYGTNAQTTSGMPAGILGMWAGNANNDAIIQYSGTDPDTPSILSEVLNDDGNFLNFPTFTITGYMNQDINMDGNTQYSGTNPDTPIILQNALAHPGNFLNFSTYQIIEQLPENE
jgi:surface protein